MTLASAQLDPRLHCEPTREELLRRAVDEACARIAPLWPLSGFVAVNPFLGFAQTPFEDAAREIRRLTGARTVMPRSFYREAIGEGRIAQADIAAALAEARSSGVTPERLLHAVAADPAPPARIPTVADVLDALSDGDRQVSRTAFMVDEISRWCAAYFDQGQAAWPAPWRSMGLYQAWRWSVRFDGNPAAMGVKGLAETASALPADPLAAIAEVLQQLAIPAQQWTDYLYRALFDIRGWAAFVRRLDWEAELAGRPGARLAELLAVRVVWGYALFRQHQDQRFTAAWRQALAKASTAPRPAPAAPDELAIDLILHRAYEHACQRRLIGDLAPASRRDSPPPQLQAVFCIDVRSEVYRRALESVWPEAETLGFAGFFGMPLSYGEGRAPAQAHCPVLLQPSLEVRGWEDAPRPLAGLSDRAARPWQGLKRSAVSCFAFVEAFGLAYGVKLARAATGAAPPKRPPDALALVTPALPLARRIDLAEGALRGMSLVGGFAPLVLLVGHASSTTNNAHAAGLDCGACGGHSGAPNARFAAALLNDPAVRAGLADRGIEIPSTTRFLAALHDTTTDAVSILDRHTVPPSHAAAVETAAERFGQASALARAERAPRLGLTAAQSDRVFRRAGDWAQVRPEWGLARASAFIAAPRALTAGRDLQGRAFLHSYDRHADPDLKVLELILTAPMVVASWIALQYYGSTVDPAAFGAGDKTLHNVCGRLGVLEGNAGDLRTGLPLQSVHDGARFVHEPVRLNVLIAAAPEAISKVLARQPDVRALIDNRWLFLFALDDDGRPTHRYAGALAWEVLA